MKFKREVIEFDDNEYSPFGHAGVTLGGVGQKVRLWMRVLVPKRLPTDPKVIVQAQSLLDFVASPKFVEMHRDVAQECAVLMRGRLEKTAINF